MESYSTYRRFTDAEEAEALTAILDRYQVPYRIDREKPPVDLSFNPDRTHERILIFVPRELFGEADRALAAVAEASPELEEDHYLHDFSDDELKGVLFHSHEWSPGDGVAARKLLETRGVKVSEEEVERRRQESLTVSHQPVRGSAWLLAAGFLFALLGGVLGVVLGWSFLTMKDTDASGKEHLHYDERTRDLAKCIVLIGAISMVGWLGLRLLSR